MMIDRFLLFMKMFLTGLFKFVVGAVAYLAVVIGVLIVVETIASFKLLMIIWLILLVGATGIALIFIADDFWSRYKRERDYRGL